MPLGIRPTNDFAFQITFGTAENKLALISLLNAILEPDSRIIEVTLLNPFNLQEFEQDKLSVLDVKAADGRGRFTTSRCSWRFSWGWCSGWSFTAANSTPAS